MKKRLQLFSNLATLLLTLFVMGSSYGQNALDFDGVDDYVLTSYNGLYGNGSRTIEAWIKPTFKTGQVVIADMGNSGTGTRFTFNIMNGYLRIEVQGSGQTGSIYVSDNSWHHVAVTYNNSLSTNKYSLYVDGVLDMTFDLSTTVNTGSGPFMIGSRVDNAAGRYFYGQMDEVRVWNTARSLTELIADSAAEFCTNKVGLVAYHKFNSGTAGSTNTNDTISYDDSGLNNHGDLLGFALTGSASNWISGKLAPCNPPSCANPVNVNAVNAFGTTADVYWTQSNTGSTVKVEYGTTGFTLGQGTKLTPSNDTISLTGLSPQTTYDVYVKEICSATDSSSWSMVTFSTGCGVISTFPYLESFDSTNVWVSGIGSYNSGASIDPCWTINPSYASLVYSWGPRSTPSITGNTGPSSDYSGNGNYVYAEASFGATGAKANFISPNYDFSSLTVPQLTFQAHMYGINTGTLSVWVWNGSSYDTVWSQSGDQGNMWHEVTIDLGAYANATTHMVFHAVRGAGYSGDLAIDHVQIEETPPCPKPAQVYLDSITSSSVNVNFVSGGTKFVVEYGPTGFSQGTGTTDTITGSGQTISGLTPNSGYDFYVMNDCRGSANGFSPWSGPYSVNTLCGISGTYYANWDQLANNQPDLCWSFLQVNSTSGYARAYSPPSGSLLQPFSGSNYYLYSNGTASDAYLTSPEVTSLSQNNMQIRFQASDIYVGSTGTPTIYVGTMASPSDVASFVPVDTIITTANVWNEFTVQLTNVPANHRYISLRHGITATAVFLSIDDLYIEPIPSCIPPSGAVFSQVQDTSVVIDWISGDATTFDLEYGVAGFIQGTGIAINGMTDTNEVINGLTAETCYDFYFRGNCGSNNSPWYGPVTVCTECATEVAPYLQDFEDTTWTPGTYNNNQINPCWNRTPEAILTYRWETGSGPTPTSNTGPLSGASGSNQYIFTESSSGANASIATLQTPQIDFSSLTNPTLSFAYHMYGATIGNLYVLISNGTQFDTIHTISGAQQSNATSQWKWAYIDISSYSASARVFHIVGERGSALTGDIALDEISVDEMPSCAIPDSFALDSLNSTFADFSWNSVANGSAFKLQYGPSGFNQASNTGSNVYTSSSPASVTGLVPNTTYDIYVADMCDSTNWVGPITFTTLINDDAELQSLVSPSNLVCGDSSFVVEVMVRNNGSNTITSMGVGANISGAINTFISNSFSGTIPPGGSATITVGTINTYAGGIINIEAFTGLPGDQDIANDTLKTNAIEVISAQPMLHPIDSLCANDSIGQFAAMAQTGIIYNWYQNVTDVTPFATGDTIDALPNQTLFVDRAKEADQQLGSGFSGSHFGNMFKVYIVNDITFSGFSFAPKTSGLSEPIAFYKNGNFRGHETTPADWTAIDSIQIANTIAGQVYRLNFTNPVQLNAGDTISFYLANKQGTKIEAGALSNVTNIGDLFINSADIEFYAGVGGGYFGNNMATNLTTPQGLQAIMHYQTNEVCGNKRVSFTMGVRSDSAMASFTHTVSNAVDVDFDASASTGHVYTWNFGDGNNGSGENTNHTYSNSGAYKVTLTVTDTVCGTTDTISQTVNITIGLSEYALDGRVAVYPNPNNGNFKVDLNLNGADDVQLVLVNTIGQIMYNQYLGQVGTSTTTELNIENLTPGIYHLHVITGGISTTVKVSVFK